MTTAIETAQIVNEGEVLSYKLPVLRKQIETMNRKAVKLGMALLTLFVGERIVRSFKRTDAMGLEKTVEREYVKVTVTGERPVLSGWILAAVKNVMPNGEMLLSEVPGVTLPDRFKSPAWNCEHCNMNRRRKELVIVKHLESGEYKQVGKTCLKDFLGGMNVKGYLEYYSMIVEVLSGDIDPDEPGYSSDGRGATCYDPTYFLTVAALIIRKIGWVSVAKSRDTMTAATMTLVCMYVRGMYPEDKELRQEVGEVSGADKALATAALEWSRSHSPESTSGYLYNLGVAARQDCVMDKTMGIVASAISAYQRYLDKQQEQKAQADKAPTVHVGTVGKREVFSVTVKAVRCFDGDYGVRSLVRMEDESGNVLTWWTGEAPEWTEKTDPVKVKGTVKKHEDYKGTPQTVLTRVALV